MHLYFTGTGIIFQVDISQRLDWSATSHTKANIVDQRKWYFPWYPIFYYTVSLFNWLWQTRVKFTCFPSHATKTKGCHDQQSEWTMFYLYDSLIILSFLFTLIYFVCFSEFCTSIYRRAIGLNTLISKMPVGQKSRTLSQQYLLIPIHLWYLQFFHVAIHQLVAGIHFYLHHLEVKKSISNFFNKVTRCKHKRFPVNFVKSFKVAAIYIFSL